MGNCPICLYFADYPSFLPATPPDLQMHRRRSGGCFPVAPHPPATPSTKIPALARTFSPRQQLFVQLGEVPQLLARVLVLAYRRVSRHRPRIRGRCQETWRTLSSRAPRSASLEARGCAQESVFTASAVKCVALGIATRGMHGLAVIWFECRPRVPVMLSRAAGVHGETRGWANAGLHEPFGSNHHQLNNNGRSTVSVNQAGQWLREVR